MAKYKVKVVIIAQCEYEVEVEASSDANADQIATGMWRDKVPDFQVNQGYITSNEAEVDQLTAECKRCGVEYPIPNDDEPDAPLAWNEDYEYCAKCGAEILAEEAATLGFTWTTTQERNKDKLKCELSACKPRISRS